jgi:hypothetical protein
MRIEDLERFAQRLAGDFLEDRLTASLKVQGYEAVPHERSARPSKSPAQAKQMNRRAT